MNAQDRADKCAELMWAGDEASKWLGLELQSVAPGKAVMTLKVESKHLNGHKICHGGYIFTLADSTFAFACNTYNQNTVAQTCSVSFVSPGKLGDELKAEAVEINRTGRSGIYDITVTNQNSEVIAHFRGHSRTIKGQHFEENEA